MAEKICPALCKPCIEHGCHWYIQLLGMDPQSGESLNKWGCTLAFLPLLVIEQCKETRQAAAAIESARNEARTDTTALAASTLRVAEAVAALGGSPAVGINTHTELRGAIASVPRWRRLLRLGEEKS